MVIPERHPAPLPALRLTRGFLKFLRLWLGKFHPRRRRAQRTRSSTMVRRLVSPAIGDDDPQRTLIGREPMTAIPDGRAQSNPASYASSGYMYGMTRRDLMAASALGLLAGVPRLARAA